MDGTSEGEPADAAALARLCAARMWETDHASRGLGMVIESVGPGTAELTMAVRPDMVNGHGMAHGGFVFALADSAFAFACNTYDEVCVAGQCNIVYLAPGHLGATLTARARETSRVGRSGIYDVTVSDGAAVIAEFRGQSRTLGRKLLD